LHIDVAVGLRVGDDNITAVVPYDRLKLAPAPDRRECMPRAEDDSEM
jgi:hypothetical protein